MHETPTSGITSDTSQTTNRDTVVPMPFITKTKSQHNCNKPRATYRRRGGYRFGEGTVWQCRKCKSCWKHNNRGFWEPTTIE